MFQIDHPSAPSERRSARKELRMRPSDEAKIRRAASAMGLSDTDFIVEAAMAKASNARGVLALDIIGLRVCIGSRNPQFERPGSRFG